MVNENMDEVVLVKGWKKSANWSFPRGKINKEESDLDCAIREVYEETGLDLKAAGLVVDGDQTKSIEVTMREQHMKLFVFRNVPMDFEFQPQTRKEISKIQWYKISELPTVKKNKQHQEGAKDALAGNANKFYMVAPFLGSLKKWIAQQRKQDKVRSTIQPVSVPQILKAEGVTVAAETPPLDEPHKEGSFTNLMHLLDKSKKHNIADDPPVSVNPADLLADHTSVMETMEKPDSSNVPLKQGLLSLLRNETIHSPDIKQPPPQTPAAQIVEEPQMPLSPPHHHLSRMPTLPTIPRVAEGTQHISGITKENVKVPQMKPAPPLIHPGRLVLQDHSPQRGRLAADHVNGTNLHTFYRSEDPHHQTPASLFAGEHDKAPPASKLPPPRITPHSANLLSLFKTKETEGVEAFPRLSENVPGRSIRNGKQSSALPATLIPPQVLRKPPSQTISHHRPMSGQQASLLDLFRKPSAVKLTATENVSPSLQPPSAPIELSAQSSPGHSREPSEQANIKYEKLHHEDSRRAPSQGHSHKKLNLPVSATVSGPLNVPQFHMVAKDQTAQRQKATTKGHSVPEKRPAITILARPGSSHAARQGAENAETHDASVTSKSVSDPMSVKRDAPPVSTSGYRTSPKISQPPTPKLSPQPAPPKPATFQPQILRRQAQYQPNRSIDQDEPSPIQPLPSPAQYLPKAQNKLRGHSSAADEHKKSLLSLFTTNTYPSAKASPPSALPASADAGHPASALISPLGEEPAMPRQENRPLTARATGMERQQSLGSGQPRDGKNQMTDVTRNKLLGILANVKA